MGLFGCSKEAVCDMYRYRYHELVEKYNELVSLINARGGTDFLYGESPQQFTQEEIKKLLMLCHPDKHNGKQMAQDITNKLLTMRK